MDLISLDSPFITESLDALNEHEGVELDFENSWNALEQYASRGWCEEPVDSVARRLQVLQFSTAVISADQRPFLGALSPLLVAIDEVDAVNECKAS